MNGGGGPGIMSGAPGGGTFCIHGPTGSFGLGP